MGGLGNVSRYRIKHKTKVPSEKRSVPLSIVLFFSYIPISGSWRDNELRWDSEAAGPDSWPLHQGRKRPRQIWRRLRLQVEDIISVFSYRLYLTHSSSRNVHYLYVYALPHTLSLLPLTPEGRCFLFPLKVEGVLHEGSPGSPLIFSEFSHFWHICT